MSVKPCLDCHQPTRNGSRCQRCTAAHEARRGTRQQRGYTNAWLALVREAIEEEPWCHVPGCPYPVTRFNPLTGDHIVPLSQGGQSTRENLRVVCKRANSSKGAR